MDGTGIPFWVDSTTQVATVPIHTHASGTILDSFADKPWLKTETKGTCTYRTTLGSPRGAFSLSLNQEA